MERGAWVAVVGVIVATGCGRIAFDGVGPAGDANGDGAGDGDVSTAHGVATGGDHACAISAGVLSCWGNNLAGQIGLEMITMMEVTPRTVDPSRRWRSVTAGNAHTCAIDEANKVWCWGDNSLGQLGLGDTAAHALRERVVLPGPATRIAAMVNHTCALLDTARMYCWGVNVEGQLGQNDLTSPPIPMPVPVTTMAWSDVAVGQGHTLGLAGTQVYGTGRNSTSELGLGGAAAAQYRVMTPTAAGQIWRSIAAGQNTSCAIATDDALWCWGGNANGELGFGDMVRRDVPTLVDATRTWFSVDVDTFDGCGIAAPGDLWCWGRNVEGQLGTGDSVDQPVPVKASTFPDWTTIAVGRFFTCGLRTDGVWCAGENGDGTLGTGDTNRRTAWTRVPL